MKFCLLTTSYPQFPDESINSGVFVRDFALGLCERGHNVVIFTPTKTSAIIADGSLTVHAFPWRGRESVVTRLNPFRPGDALQLLSLWRSGVQEILKWGPEQHFDRLLAFWAIPSGWFGYRLQQKEHIPLDVWVLGSDVWKRRRYPLGHFLVRRVLRAATRVFTDGEELRREATALSGSPAVLLRSMRRLPAPLKQVTLSAGKTHFIFVGRWDPVKGLDVFVEAFLRLAGEIPCEAHIIGQGPMEKWLKKRLAFIDTTAIHVYGTMPPADLASYLQAADFAVIPSRQESLPVFFSDCMQAGLPVIVSDVGDLRSFVEGYHTGLVVEPDHVESLVSAMKQAAYAGKGHWQKACRELAASVFNPGASVETYLSIIQSALV